MFETDPQTALKFFIIAMVIYTFIVYGVGFGNGKKFERESQMMEEL